MATRISLIKYSALAGHYREKRVRPHDVQEHIETLIAALENSTGCIDIREEEKIFGPLPTEGG